MDQSDVGCIRVWLLAKHVNLLFLLSDLLLFLASRSQHAPPALTLPLEDAARNGDVVKRALVVRRPPDRLRSGFAVRKMLLRALRTRRPRQQQLVSTDGAPRVVIQDIISASKRGNSVWT
jgi:hypothetical protein